jgi:hypothetical protein
MTVFDRGLPEVCSLLDLQIMLPRFLFLNKIEGIKIEGIKLKA